MTTVKMEKECGCFKRSDFESTKTFEDKNEALIYALEICEAMNESFCQKHRFSVTESAEREISISMAMQR